MSVALDDFGTGYSGLYHLTQLAIDKIKIDQSFFDESLDNSSEMVTAILALGKSLRIQITAEGVEHEQLAKWLASHKCDFAQGYLFGRPVPAPLMMALVATDRTGEPLRA
ncbi:EAL domain-containing protein [Xanthomonas sp. WHRI 1810A]|uniref:EAL domain-containing protein n=1 Tax=Xanthomonas sp. WHRI 1810A TaxID=3161565 RepID=UPI003F8847C7